MVRSIVSLSLLATGIGAIDSRFRNARRQAAPAAMLPMITGAPLPAAVELRLARRQSTDDFRVPDCATSCLSSAVINHTNCELFEHMCTCDDQNALQIYAAAQPCLNKACGYTNDVMYMLSQDCLTYLSTATTETTTTTKKPTSTGSPSTFVATKTESDGSVATVTAVINPTSSWSTPSSPAPSSKGSSGLSKGAIAGIAVGAALGGTLVITRIVLLIYRRMSKRQRTGPPGAAAETAVVAAPPPRSKDKAELPSQGKPASPTTISVTPVAAFHAPSDTVSPSTVKTSPMSASTATTPSPPPAVQTPESVQQSAVSWQGPRSQQQQQQQQPQLYQAVPSAQGGFVMVPIQPSPGGAVEIGAPGRDMGPVEVAGEPRQYELPAQLYNTGPYEMPAPRGS